MIEIKTLEIAGLGSVLNALRLPFGKECRSQVDWYGAINEDYQLPMFQSESKCFIDEKDLKLLSTLVKRGTEHAKAIRGLVVYAEINAPLFWWVEADTYRIGTDRLSSESTMHTIGNGGVNIYNFSVPKIIYDILGEEPKKVKDVHPLVISTPEELQSVVKNYFGRDYEIWNNGDIYALPFDSTEVLPNGSTRTRHFDKQKITIGNTKNQQGYYQVHLGGRKGKTMVLHRILAEAFVPNPSNFNVVNHKDGNKWNCSISNLEWCTSSYNNKHAFDTGLKEISIKQKYMSYKRLTKWTDEDVENWKEMRKNGLTLKEISDACGATENVVCQYTKGNRYNSGSDLSLWFSLAKYYEDLINQINDYSALYKESGDFDYVLRIKEMLPTSFIQKRIQMFSYQCIRNIVKQREGHRLPEWKTFIDWARTLPFAEELIFVGLDKGAKEQ